MVHRHTTRPGIRRRSLPFHQRKEDCFLLGARKQRAFYRGDGKEGTYHRDGIRVHEVDSHRELMDCNQEGPCPPLQVHAGMERERQQEESDCCGSKNTYRTLKGVHYLRHGVCGRNSSLMKEDRAKWLRNDGVQRIPDRAGNARCQDC